MDVCGELRDEMVFPKHDFADIVGFFSDNVFVEEAAGVDVFVEEDVEDVRAEQVFVLGLQDASDWGDVDDDDVASHGEVAADESLTAGLDVLEAQHESRA